MKKGKKLLVLASVGVLSVTLYACNNNNTGTVTRENTNQNTQIENFTELESSLNNLEAAVNKYNNVNARDLTISSIAPSSGETNYITSNGASQGSEYYSYLNKMNGVYNSNVNVSTSSTTLNQTKSDVTSSIRNLRNSLNNTNQNAMASDKKEVVNLYTATFNRIADNLNNLSEGYNSILSNYKNLNLENLDLTNAKYSAILYEMELANANLNTSKKALESLREYLNPTSQSQTSLYTNSTNQNTNINPSGISANNKMQNYNDQIVNNGLTNNTGSSSSQNGNYGIQTLEEPMTTSGDLTSGSSTNQSTTTLSSNNETNQDATTLPMRPQPRADLLRRNGRVLRRSDRIGRPISRLPRLSDDTLQGDNMGQNTTSTQTTSTLSFKPTAVVR